MSNPFVAIPEPPNEPYRSAEWIREHVFAGMVSRRWVLDNCPREALSPRKIVFLESKVRSHFGDQAA